MFDAVVGSRYIRFMNSAEIKAAAASIVDRDTLELLSDGLPHFFSTSETMYKSVKRLAKAGTVKITVINRTTVAAKLK